MAPRYAFTGHRRRHNTRLSALGAATAFLAFAAVAWAGFRHQTSTHEWSAVSGNAGSAKEKSAGLNAALHRLSFYEKLDDPVRIVVYSSNLVANGSAALGLVYQNMILRDGGVSEKTVDVGIDHYITALQVCTNDATNSSDRKIKGARIWGKRLSATGALIQETSASFERPNCKQWATKVQCPAGKVATGLRAYYVSQAKGFIGLAMRCTAIEPT